MKLLYFTNKYDCYVMDNHTLTHRFVICMTPNDQPNSMTSIDNLKYLYIKYYSWGNMIYVSVKNMRTMLAKTPIARKQYTIWNCPCTLNSLFDGFA